jgi:hypothetical protein
MRVHPAPQPQRIDRQEAVAAVRVVPAVVPLVPGVSGATRVLQEVKGLELEQVGAEAKIREAKVVAKATAAKAQQARAVANRVDPEVKAAGFGSSA